MTSWRWMLLYEACIVQTTYIYQTIVQRATTPRNTHLLCNSYLITLVSTNALITPWPPLILRNRQLWYLAAEQAATRHPHARRNFLYICNVFRYFMQTAACTTSAMYVWLLWLMMRQVNFYDDAWCLVLASASTPPAQFVLRKSRHNAFYFSASYIFIFSNII